MKTRVYQSFRNFDVPPWMSLCMESVQQWAESQGYSYHFIDDNFFSYVPESFKKAVNAQRHLVADLARLELAALYLSQEWDRVIWVDADVFICDPVNFRINESASYHFCRELWMTARDGEIVFSERVNNSITMFCKHNHFLDFYRTACQAIISNKKGKLAHTDIGTGFLTRIADALPLINTAVVFSPFLLVALYRNDEEIINKYLTQLGCPIEAANLCLTFRNSTYQHILFDDDFFLTIISRLKSLKRL